jgi:acetylornithine deacetylase/succinyl-diaminopimelate desuccinylase-like protein
MALTPADSINLLKNLVAIPSPSGQEKEASAWLADWMAAHGFDAQVDAAGNAVGTQGDGPHQVMLLGHIDTFPGELPLRQEGDWLYGRGTVDAKGPLCAFVAATAALGVPPGWQVTVVGAVEEEAAPSPPRPARRSRGGQSPIHLTFSGAEVAFRAEKNTPLVRAFLTAIRGWGGQPRFVLKTGTSDMNVVGPAWGCPILAYGPGDSALDHTPQERISLREYLQSIQILKSALHTLMGNT